MSMMESEYNVVEDPTTGMRLRLIITPGGGTAGTGSVEVADFANGTLIAQAIEAWLTAHLLEGAGVSLDKSTPGQVTVINTSGAGSYTDEQVRDVIAAALQGVATRVSITPDDVGNTITVDVDPLFVARVATLEAVRSLIQVKEPSTSGGGENFMVLPGGSGNYVSTPSNATFNVAGDMTVVARIKMPAAAPGATFTIAGRWGATTAAGQWRWHITNPGQMQLAITVDGVATSTATTSAAVPLTFDGNWIWLRFSRTAADGTVDFQYAADTGSDNIIPATWTTFQLNRATTLGALNATSGAALTVGAYNDGANNIFTGSIGRVLVIDGLVVTGGTVLADANAADYTTGTTWAGPSNTWTLNGTATVTLVGGGATASTAAKFTLGDTDAFAGIDVEHRDILYFFSQGGLVNTSGSAVNFTFEVVVDGVILSTYTPISLPSVAASVYRYEFSLTIEMNATDGTTQVYAWTMRIYDAVTGTYIGSATSSAVLYDIGGGFSDALSTYTTVPAIELKLTMGTAASTISAGATNTRLSMQKG